MNTETLHLHRSIQEKLRQIEGLRSRQPDDLWALAQASDALALLYLDIAQLARRAERISNA